MATWLRQSTAIEIPIGPFLDDTDGKTQETALTITQPDIRLKKNGSAWAQKNASQTLSHEEAGWYEVALDTTDTNTLGILVVAIHEAGALPVWREFLVVPGNVYDSIVGGGDILDVSVTQWLGTAAATPAVAGLPSVDAIRVGGTAQTGRDIGASVSVASGTSDSGTTTTMVDAARTEGSTDYWKGNFILFTSGNIAGQCRLITGFNAATDTITFSPATDFAVGTHTYEILPVGRVDVGLWAGSVVNALISGRVDAKASAMGTDVIDSLSIAASAIAEIQSGLATSSALTTAQSDLDDIQARLPAALTADGNIKSDALRLGGTLQTGRDIGTSVLLSPGSGTGQLDFTSGVVKSNLSQILGTALTETAGLLAAGFKKFFNIASPVSTMDVIARTTLTDTVTTNSDKTGYSLSSAAIQAIWDALTSALTTAGSIGKKLADWVIGTSQTGDSYARLGPPAGASIAADTAAVKADTAAVKTKTDNLPSDPADESLIIAATDAVMARLGAPVGASMSADVAAVQSDTNDIQSRLPAVLIGGKMDSLTSIRTGTAQAGAATTITFDAGASAVNEFYKRDFVLIVSGTGALQPPVRVVGYVGATKVATVAPGWVVNPDNTSVYVIIPGSMFNMYLGAK